MIKRRKIRVRIFKVDLFIARKFAVHDCTQTKLSAFIVPVSRSNKSKSEYETFVPVDFAVSPEFLLNGLRRLFTFR